MTNIFTYEIENDLCCVKYNTTVFIGYIDLPQQHWSVKEYNEWCNKSTVNMICVSNNYTPQMLPNNGMNIIWNLKYLHKCFEAEFKTKQLNTFSFKDLYLSCIENEDAISGFYNYIKSLYKISDFVEWIANNYNRYEYNHNEILWLSNDETDKELYTTANLITIYNKKQN